jgi:hypothetical protein
VALELREGDVEGAMILTGKRDVDRLLGIGELDITPDVVGDMNTSPADAVKTGAEGGLGLVLGPREMGDESGLEGSGLGRQLRGHPVGGGEEEPVSAHLDGHPSGLETVEDHGWRAHISIPMSSVSEAPALSVA